MYCSKCGNEIKEGEEFCNKCGNKNKKIKISIIQLLIFVLFIVIVIALITISNKDKFVSNEISNNTLKNVESNKKASEQQVISFKQMDARDTNLTEEQQLVAFFFDEDYFQINSYEEIVRYADMLKNINVHMYCKVKAMLNTDENNYEAVCYWAADQEDLWNPKELTEEYIKDYIVIKGKKPSKMFLEGDNLNIRGKLVGAETRVVNGENKYVPIIETIEIGEEADWYGEDTVRKISKIVFGNNIKVRRPTDEETLKMVSESFYTYQDYVWLVEMENQSNLNFKVFDIWQNRFGIISYNGIYNQGMESDYVNKKLYVTPDLQKYIVFDYSRKDNYIYVSVYNRDLNKLWSKELSNVSQITWDATNSNLVFISNNDFYNINIETGENIYSPIYVGKRKDVRIIENGYIILSDDYNDAIMFLDENGNIKNKHDLKIREDFKIVNAVLQKMDDKYIVLYELQNKDNKYVSEYVILDKEGNKINESK